MALTTYTELKASISGWLNRTDLTARIPDFIALAEAGMSRVLRVNQMITRSTAASDDEFTAIPTNFLELIAFALSDGTKLLPVTHDQIVAAKENDATTGKPRFYTRLGDSFQLYPAPDQSYTLELTYYGSPSALSDSVASNWILAKAPDAYLYGALLQAAPYLRDAERLQVWSGLYDNALASLRASDKRTVGALRVDAGLMISEHGTPYNINTDV